MNRLLRLFVPAICTLALVLLCTTNSDAQNLALGRPVITGTGSWSGDFPFSKVTDGNTSEPNDGPISYWLGRELTAPESFTLDLGEVREIDQVKLFNTHNRQFNDRGTDEFVLYGGSTLGPGNVISDEFAFIGGNLSNTSGQANITPDVYNAGTHYPTGITARYLRFEAFTHVPPVNGFGGVGLNEIEVYDVGFVNPNVAAGKPVIEGSGAYFAEPINGGPFPGNNVTNENPSTYWLSPEGSTTGHFTIDLLSSQPIQELRITNTANHPHADRGTRLFRVLASDTVDGANQLVGGQVILEGQLPNVAGMSPPPSMTFTDDNGLTPRSARYLRFETLSSYYDGAGTGLAELEAYNTELHPASQLIREGNIAAGKPVIGGSGAWDGGVPCVGQPVNGGAFPANRVTDESLADSNSTRTSYWLGREACTGEYFTVDLEGTYDLDEIVLTNAHNTQFFDRGTGEFAIYGSNTVDAAGRPENPVLVVAGELTAPPNPQTLGQPIPKDSFLIDPSVPPVRYLEFHALTILSSATNSGAGLNELAAYGTLIPEPGSWTLLAVGLAAVGWAARRRHRKQP